MYASKLCVGNMDVIRVLINYGQSPGVEEKDLEEGNTPLHWAIVGGVQSPYALSPILKVFVCVREREFPCGCVFRLHIDAVVPFVVFINLLYHTQRMDRSAVVILSP